MTIYTVLPDSNFITSNTGRSEWHPVIRVNKMRCRNAVIFLHGRRYCPNQAHLKDILISLHSSTKLTVKRIFCIGIRFKSRSEAFRHKRLGKTSQEISVYRFVLTNLKKDNGSLRNTKFKSKYINFFSKNHTLLFVLFFSLIAIDGCNLATLAMKKPNLIFIQTVFTGKIPTIEVRIDFVANDPLKLFNIVLKKVDCYTENAVFSFKRIFFKIRIQIFLNPVIHLLRGKRYNITSCLQFDALFRSM